MPAPLLTGSALLVLCYDGLRRAGWHLHIVHATRLVTASVFAAVFLGPRR